MGAYEIYKQFYENYQRDAAMDPEECCLRLSGMVSLLFGMHAISFDVWEMELKRLETFRSGGVVC